MDLVTATIFSTGAFPDSGWSDQVLTDPSLGLLAVADAPGGGKAARAGIKIALETVRTTVERQEDILKRFRRHPSAELRARLLDLIEESFHRAAQELFAYARRRAGLRVTLDVVLVVGNEAFVGHVGDGRVYLMRRGLVHQLTVDHLRGDQTVEDLNEPDAGTPREVSNGGRARVRALGPTPAVRVESLCMELSNHDRFLLCANGLHRGIPEGVLHHHLVSEHLEKLGATLKRCAPEQPLVAAAAQLGGGEPEVMDGGRSRLAILSPMPLFAHCSERELRIVASATHPQRYHASEVMFEEGEPGTELYLIISGSIRIERGDEEIATLGAGSTLGEMALLDEPLRSASAIAAEDTEVMIISREAFFALLKGNPMLAVKILWNMLRRLSANLRTTSAELARYKAGNTD